MQLDSTAPLVSHHAPPPNESGGSPASTNPAYSLTIHNAKAADYGLKIGLVWWIIGMVLATGYFVFVYRYFAGKVSLPAEEEGY